MERLLPGTGIVIAPWSPVSSRDMKMLREAQAKDALTGNKGLPLHPGAARYYKEKGLM